MATRSFIAQKLPSGSFRAIYCHWDGHPDSAGLTLHTYYSSDAAVDALLALGSLSELGKTPEVCVAHHRDKGEYLTPAAEYDHYSNMTKACFNESGGEFLYVWEDGAWLCNSKPLAPILAKAGLLPAVEQPASPTPDWAVLGPRLAAALKGAQQALRKALPYCPADEEHDGDSVFVGEWLDEVNETVALLPA
jgi:hypothetical protein